MPKPASQPTIAFAIIFTFFAAVLACSSSSKTSQTNIDEIVKNRLGNQYTVAYNSSRSYALCQQSPAGDHVNRTFKYVVVKMSDHNVTKEGSFRNGYVKWIDDTAIEVGTSGTDEKIEKEVIRVEAQKS